MNIDVKPSPPDDVNDPHRITIPDLDCQLRVYEPDPIEGDLSRMYVIEALGVYVQFRQVNGGTKVHIESKHKPLIVEVNNGGENTYE